MKITRNNGTYTVHYKGLTFTSPCIKAAIYDAYITASVIPALCKEQAI